MKYHCATAGEELNPADLELSILEDLKNITPLVILVLAIVDLHSYGLGAPYLIDAEWLVMFIFIGVIS